MEGLHVIYHYENEIRTVTTKEYEQFLATKEWFDCPRKAFMYKYLHRVTTWTIRQASFLLSGQNPDSKSKDPTSEVDYIRTRIDQDYIVNKIELKKKRNTRSQLKYMTENVVFIEWAIQSGLKIPQELVDYLNACSKDNLAGQPINHKVENPSHDQKSFKCEKEKIWEGTFAKLHESASSIQKGNKMEVIDSVISLILNTVKKIHPDFDPMIMPGTVEDFHEFCLNMPCGSDIFPYKKKSFGKYCKRTIKKSEKKLPPLCAWENPSTPNKKFWDALKTNNKSYTVNRMTFA